MIANAVYALCALTSAGCAGLLIRAYFRKGSALLLWSSIGFVGLGISNILLYADLVIYTQIDLLLWRHLAALIGLICLIFGLIWEAV